MLKMSSLDNHGAGELTHRLEFREVFNSLKEDEIKDEQPYGAYVHHLARACWHGGRIMLRQTSPEAEGIFDFILELNAACNGQWNQLLDYGIMQKDLDTWLDFAGMFLSSLGNHFVSN
jgi:dipeptidyl-peptidase III